MLHIIFWMLFLFTPLSMFFLLRIAAEQINQISVVSLVCIFLYAFSMLGTLPLFYQLDAYRVATGVTDPELVLVVTFFSSVSIIIFLLGVIFVRRILGLIPIPIVSKKITTLNSIRFFSIILLMVLVILILYIYLEKINKVALWVVFTDGVKAANIARSKMGNDFSGKHHWYHFVLHHIGTIITLTFYVSWLLKKNLLNAILLIISFSISAFVAVMAIEKEPFISLLIALFMAYYLTRRNGYVPKKDIIIFGAIVISVLMFFYMYFTGSNSPVRALSSVFSRAFAGSISPAYFYLEYFPRHHDFLMGKTFPNPGGVLPYTPFPYTVELMNWKFANHIQDGVVGSMPTVFWGEAYANFGYVGIPIVAFVMGVLVAVLSYIVSKLELNPLTIAFTVWLIFHLKNLSIAGFSGYLYDFYMIFTSLVVIAVLFTTNKIGIRNNKKIKYAVS